MFRDWLLSLSSSTITHYNISTYIYLLRVRIISCSHLTVVCLVQESGHYLSLAIPWRYDHPKLLAAEVIKVYEESIVLGGILLNGK
ncbi:unnamed protein product [Lactuca virosa]|uniref:Uncharacterized protein n=1 Tax=Lactuca virosa TaxID=75947 RepID=A0AAU9LS67_9ASTR|nr:unnamed protein product [Lactuca virosa]